MADHRPSQPADDAQLRKRLSSLGASAGAAAASRPSPGMSDVRARARRRRGAVVGGASALAAAVISIGVVGASDWGRDDAQPPAGPTPSLSALPAPTATTTAEPVPTTEPVPTPTVQAPTSAPPASTSTAPSSAPPASTSTAPTSAPPASTTTAPTSAPPASTTTAPTSTQSPARPVPTTIPDDLRLPHEGETEDGVPWVEGEVSGNLCDSTSLPQLPGYASVTDSRHISHDAFEQGRDEELLVLQSAEAAVQLMAQVRSAAQACPSVYGDPDEQTVSRVEPLSGAWGEGILVRSSFRNEGAPPDAYVGGGAVAIIRTGSAIALVSGGGEFSQGVRPDGEPSEPIDPAFRAGVDDMAELLCVFTEAGC